MVTKKEYSTKQKAKPRSGGASECGSLVDKFKFSRLNKKRKEEFNPVKEGMSLESYLDDYEPEGMHRTFAKGKDVKVGRPRKDVRVRLREYMQNESKRLQGEMQEQDGTEYNIIRRLLNMPDRDQEKRSKGRKRKLERPLSFQNEKNTSGMPKVSGTVNVYEFGGRTKVMERLVQMTEEMEKWDINQDTYATLLWWWCKDAISRSHEERGKLSVKDLTKAFEDDRRIWGMINQLERVRNRISHVVKSADMDYEKIRSHRPKVGLVELMKQKAINQR